MLKWILGKRTRTSDRGVSLPSGNLPAHVAIIMDGNGRWANRRGLPRVAGHRAGMSKVREVIRACDELGIRCLTLYAFSTENWKRPPQEVEYLMRLPEEFFRTEIDELVERGVRVRFIGDTSQLPPYTQETVQRTLEKTRDNHGMIVNFALNYGGRADIVGAVKAYAREVASGLASWDELDEARLDAHLSTAGLPDPDLVIRTSGEIRLSNFLIWQAAYAELWFTDVLWPDFTREHLEQALRDYQRRKRRFGGIK
ncbi:isoprenyl transferase [Alicyclobacillus sp.]|uniref:isoprenyl transferase n=1 Tax=Alicyclobacillus sp. TaxID=61169 RepID=UPI0025C6FEBA|nr:isoprenyl transferase [Alicyclobacillus sp.]MCL6515609.1 isoprenyl transferase [Alicyclobacillus sp.]